MHMHVKALISCTLRGADGTAGKASGERTAVLQCGVWEEVWAAFTGGPACLGRDAVGPGHLGAKLAERDEVDQGQRLRSHISVWLFDDRDRHGTAGILHFRWRLWHHRGL